MQTTTLLEKAGQQEWGEKPTKNMLFMASITLFVIMCAISIFLFFENMRLSSSIEASKNEMVDYTNSIEKIKSDRRMIAAELVTNNKSAILETVKMGETQRYVEELLSIARKYKIIFSGFSYENGKIITSAISMPETLLAGDDGIKKISHFIWDYRTGSGLLFQLSPVLSVSGYEQRRSFSVEFHVSSMPQSQ